jgi:hypothetical protein
MFPDCEQFWGAILDDPSAASDMLGRDPFPREVAYARVAAETPHLVLSKTLTDTSWPTAPIVGDLEAIRGLRGTSRARTSTWSAARAWSPA